MSVILQPIAERMQHGSMVDSLQHMTATRSRMMQGVAEFLKNILKMKKRLKFPLLTIPTEISSSKATDLNFCMTTWAFSRLNTMMQRISTERMPSIERAKNRY